MFPEHLDRKFRKHLEELEKNILHIPKAPFWWSEKEKQIRHMSREVQELVRDLHRIYESYGCDTGTAQRLLRALEEIKAELGRLPDAKTNEEILQVLKALDQILMRNIYLYVMPGKGVKGEYVKLTRLIEEGRLVSNRIELEIRGSQICRDSRPVQGFLLKGEHAEFVGYHFTNEKSANIIMSDGSFLIKNIEDPYIYLLEAMDYSGKSEQEIRHMVGSAGATDLVSAKILYPVSRIWLKAEKNRPTHFALEGDVNPEDIIRRKGSLMVHKKISEL
jgi:hypothetical protein